MSAAEFTRCPAEGCGLTAIVMARTPMITFGGPRVEVVRIECFAGHARLMPAESLEIHEVTE